MKMVPAIFGGMALVVVAAAGTARANLLVNGGLETNSTPNQFNLIWANTANGSSILPGWTVTTGTIDVVPTTYFQSSQGNFSVDLIGTPRLGGIRQTVATVPGTSYQLSFDFSVNPENLTNEGGSTKVMLITAKGLGGGVLGLEEFSGVAGTRTALDMQYLRETFTFTANSTQTTLTLAALLPTDLPSNINATNTQCGPVIDNLDLIPISVGQLPEPGSLALLGLGGTLLFRRRRRM